MPRFVIACRSEPAPRSVTDPKLTTSLQSHGNPAATPFDHSDAWISLACASVVSGIWFASTWRYGLDLADEGFFWFGSQLTLLGQVPLRDFMAYDIARYYWTATFMAAMDNDGLLPARLATMSFQLIGTAVGLRLCLLATSLRGSARWAFAIAASCVLTLAVTPHYKAFDHAASIFIVAALWLMLRWPSCQGWFLAGAVVGLMGLVGRNHTLYGAVGAAVLAAFLLQQADLRHRWIGLGAAFVAGLATGFIPMILAMAGVKGYADAYLESVLFILRTGATNISLPVPWPWLSPTGAAGFDRLSELAVGWGFVAVAVYPAVVLWATVTRRITPDTDRGKVLMASCAASIPYAHYAFARADFIHLSLASFPMIIGIVCAISAFTLRTTMCAMLIVALTVASAFQGLTAALRIRMNPTQHEYIAVGDLTIGMHRSTANLIRALIQEVDGSGSRPATFLALPNLVSLHAIRSAPMRIWEIYPLWPRDPRFERGEMARLQGHPPEVVFLSDHALDKREDLRYSVMHPMTYQWIQANYRRACRIDGSLVDVYVLQGLHAACESQLRGASAAGRPGGPSE